jgi:hypothetical protein
MFGCGQAVTLQLFFATGRKFDRGQSQLVSIGVFLHCQPIQTAKDDQRGKTLYQPFG